MIGNEAELTDVDVETTENGAYGRIRLDAGEAISAHEHIILWILHRVSFAMPSRRSGRAAHCSSCVRNAHSVQFLFETRLSDDIDSLVFGQFQNLRDVDSSGVSRSKYFLLKGSTIRKYVWP